MLVDPPKRRASGIRRVRDQRDLCPKVQTRPASRRMDASGTFLSVRSGKFSCCFLCLNDHYSHVAAPASTDNTHHRYLQHM